MSAGIGKYPFRVTVYRRPGGPKPVMQQHSFEAVDDALAKDRDLLLNDKLVLKTEVALIIKETTYHHRLRGDERA